MSNSRTKNSILYISSGVLQQIVVLLFNFITRTIFIKTLGENYLGISGIFSNVLQIFSLAELGVGSAITFYMYKPIAENNIDRIKTLMNFYKTCYRVIGSGILMIGLCLIPFLDKLVNFNTKIDVNLYVVYILFLLNSVITYLFFSYKFTIIIAYQKGYIVNLINTIFVIISCVCESTILLLFKDFILSLFIKLLIGIIKNFVTAVIADKLYPYLKQNKYKKISKREIKLIFKDIAAIFIFKVSATLFNSTDNVVISIMFGTIYVGFNSNYIMLITAVKNVVNLIQNSFIAGVGNINSSENIEKKIRTFKNLDFINFWIVSFFSVCLIQLLNPFITIWIGKKYLFSQIAVVLIVMSFFLTYSLNIVFVFRETMGLFKYGRYRQLAGGILNIILDIILGKLWGITGVFAATVISQLIFTVFQFPKIVYKYGFHRSPANQYKRIIGYYLVTIISGLVTWFSCSWVEEITFITLISECIICITVPNLVLILFYRNSDEYKYFIKKAMVVFSKLKMKF